MKPFFKKLKKSFRSRSPASSDHQFDRQADRSSTSAHTPLAPTSDGSASRSKSATASLVGTKAEAPDIENDNKSVPTITVEEIPTPLAPISTPSKKFVQVKTANSQHDLVVLHVAYILQKSANLHSLILEIVRISKKHDVRVSSCYSFV